MNKANTEKNDTDTKTGKKEFVSVQEVLGKWEQVKPQTSNELNSDEPTQQTFKKKSKQRTRVVKVIR